MRKCSHENRANSQKEVPLTRSSRNAKVVATIRHQNQSDQSNTDDDWQKLGEMKSLLVDRQNINIKQELSKLIQTRYWEKPEATNYTMYRTPRNTNPAKKLNISNLERNLDIVQELLI